LTPANYPPGNPYWHQIDLRPSGEVSDVGQYTKYHLANVIAEREERLIKARKLWTEDQETVKTLKWSNTLLQDTIDLVADERDALQRDVLTLQDTRTETLNTVGELSEGIGRLNAEIRGHKADAMRRDRTLHYQRETIDLLQAKVTEQAAELEAATAHNAWQTSELDRLYRAPVAAGSDPVRTRLVQFISKLEAKIDRDETSANTDRLVRGPASQLGQLESRAAALKRAYANKKVAHDLRELVSAETPFGNDRTPNAPEPEYYDSSWAIYRVTGDKVEFANKSYRPGTWRRSDSYFDAANFQRQATKTRRISVADLPEGVTP
jgi:hypothetical protein